MCVVVVTGTAHPASDSVRTSRGVSTPREGLRAMAPGTAEPLCIEHSIVVTPKDGARRIEQAGAARRLHYSSLRSSHHASISAVGDSIASVTLRRVVISAPVSIVTRDARVDTFA